MQIEPLLQYIVGGSGFWTERIVVLSMISVFVFPISLLRNLSALQYTSSLRYIFSLHTYVTIFLDFVVNIYLFQIIDLL